MTAVHYDTVASARQHFRELLDAAEAGIPSTVTRDRQQLAVVAADSLLQILQVARPARAHAVAEDGGWSITLPGLPVAADGETLDDALTEVIEALREYAEDWTSRLRLAPNHSGNMPLVLLISLATDDQLRAWLTA